MPSSTVLIAKRALVSLLLKLAVACHVVISINRDSADAQVQAAFRRVVLKVHPDKGGRLEDSQALHGAKARWDEVKGKHGGRQSSSSGLPGIVRSACAKFASRCSSTRAAPPKVNVTVTLSTSWKIAQS